METVQQNGRFTLFSSKFPSNIYSILYVSNVGTFNLFVQSKITTVYRKEVKLISIYSVDLQKMEIKA